MNPFYHSRALFFTCFSFVACGSEAQTSGPEPIYFKGEKGDPGTPGSVGTSGRDGYNYQPVKPLAMNGWQFATNGTATARIQTGSAYAWPYNYLDPGASSAVLSSGSGDGAGQGGKAYIGYGGLNFLPLSRLEGISWRTYVPSPAPQLSATGSGYWNVYIYLGSPDQMEQSPLNYDNLVIDPAFFPTSSYQPATDTWQLWQIDGLTSVRCRYQRLRVGPNATDLCVKDAPYPLSVFRQYNPQAFIMPPWCAEIPYPLPDGSPCDRLVAKIAPPAPGITFMVGQASGGVWKNFLAYFNGPEFRYDGYRALFVFRGD